jgi:hypothetical protein
MEPLLQPLRTMQLLDRAVHLYRRHILFFVLLCLPAVVFVAGTGELGRRALSLIYRDRSVQIFFAWIFQIGAYAMAFGATTALVVFGLRGIESGKACTVSSCYQAARSHWLRIAGIQILLALRLICIVFIGMLGPTMALSFALRHFPRLFTGFAAWRLVIGLALLFLVVASMFWMVHSYARHSFANACCVVENTGIRASLKRSRRLAKGALRRVWTIFFFALCLFIPMASLAELPAAVAGEWVKHHKVLYESWTLLASMLAMAISAPIVVLGTTLIYYDQRVRREAFDVETLISAAEAANAAHSTEQTLSASIPAVVMAAGNSESAASGIVNTDEPAETMGAASGSQV